jgi:excisionase family DNA binding protein
MQVTRQAVFTAIYNKRLKAFKEGKFWRIKKEIADEYVKTKYNRKFSTYNGRLIFDNEKGFYSMQQVANMLGIGYHQLYFAVQMGRIKYQRKGASYVFHMSDIVEFKEKHLDIQIKTA